MVTISRLKLAVNGLINTRSPPNPRMAIAAPTVVKISTMMRPSKTPTVTSCLFPREAGIESISTGAIELSACGRALISVVVDVMAAVMSESCAPT